MSRPRLSICIPTFNRAHLLRRTLDILVPQLTTDVELYISDNDSSDNTISYLECLGKNIVVARQSRNVGADRNLLSCLEAVKGEYIWITSDDDLPRGNIIAEILSILEKQSTSGVLCLRAKSSDIRVSDYDWTQAIVSWARKDPPAYLEDVGVWVTFMSSIVVRSDLIDLGYLKTIIGTSLIPAALMLHAVARAKEVMVSDIPLIYARGGNAGGYNAGVVFTTNLSRLLKECRKAGYSERSVDIAFNDSLASVVPTLITRWPLTLREHGHILWQAKGRDAFARNIVPAYRHLLKQRIKRAPFGGLARALRHPRSFFQRLRSDRAEKKRIAPYAGCCDHLDLLAMQYLRDSVQFLGDDSIIKHPIYLKNPKYFDIGRRLRAGPGLRLEAWDTYAGQSFYPLIKIGNNVGMGYNVHIGAIHSVTIADDVLIGSNVLITDHSHGSHTSSDLNLSPVERPLKCKGAVVIEQGAWLGDGVCILPNVRVGRGAIIGANAVVTRDVPPFTVVGGAPARVLRDSPFASPARTLEDEPS